MGRYGRRPRARRRRRVHVPARPEGNAGSRPGQRRTSRIDAQGQHVVRSHDQLADGAARGQQALRGQGHRAARRTGQRRARRRQSGKLAIYVGGDRDAFDRHKKLLDAIGDQVLHVGPDRRRQHREARAQLREPRHPHGHRRGLHARRQGRHGSARAVARGPARRDRPPRAPSTASATSICSRSTTRQASRCALRTRISRWPWSSRGKSACP